MDESQQQIRSGPVTSLGYGHRKGASKGRWTSDSVTISEHQLGARKWPCSFLQGVISSGFHTAGMDAGGVSLLPSPSGVISHSGREWHSDRKLWNSGLAQGINVVKCIWTLRTYQKELGKTATKGAPQRHLADKFRLCVLSWLGRLWHIP